MLIDTHCHLNFAAFEKDVDDVVRRAKEQGVGKIIVPGTDLSSSRRAVDIAKKYPGFCFAAIGVHPHHAQDPNFVINDNVRHELEELFQNREVVAVGEVGLDYYRYTKTKYVNTTITDEVKRKQQELLTLQLDLALIHKRPVIFHCRQAHDDMIQTISTFLKKADLASTNSRNAHSPTLVVKTNYIKPSHLYGVWHCFGGNAKQLQDIVTMGYYVGFDGNITYNETQYSPLVRSAPLNRILLETDAPFLTPVPHRGTRNEPGYLPYVAKTVARYLSSPLSEVIAATAKNAQALFSLP